MMAALKRTNVAGGGPLLPLLDFELNSLSFGQALVPCHLNRRVMSEQVLPLIVRGDEAEALVRVEPLNCAGSHVNSNSSGIESSQAMRGKNRARINEEQIGRRKREGVALEAFTG